jgi:RNA exonuclease 1
MLSKKEARLEKKKKKLSALSDVMKLNEKDRPNQSSTDEPISKKSKLDITGNSEEKDEILRELSIEQYKLLKKELTEKRNAIKNVPYMRLKDAGDRARICIPVEQRSPLLLNYIQHLLMVALLHSRSPYTPWRWCHIEKASKLTHSVVLVIDGINAYNFSAFESKFERANTIFETLKFETLMPAADNKVLEELACVPLTESQKDQLIRKYGSLEAAMSSSQDHTFIWRTVFSIREQQPKSTDEFELPESDKFPRTQLLLSPLQMLMNDYPLPFKGDLKNICDGYTTTKEMYDPVTPNSPMFGIDCEMCRTSTNYSELARISIVDEQHNLFYESMVLPDTEIIDYLTPYSGRSLFGKRLKIF